MHMYHVPLHQLYNDIIQAYRVVAMHSLYALYCIYDISALLRTDE